MHNLCFVTGTRADFGLLSGLIREANNSTLFRTQIVASCMHLDEKFGYTLTEIIGEGFDVSATVPMLRCEDSKSMLIRSVADGLVKFVDVYERLSPDLVIILGDRFEALAAAQAASLMGIPLAHIHGGEITEGAMDDMIRHCITKMSNLHFVAAEKYRSRVIQMGECPKRVFNVGALGVENVNSVNSLDRHEVEQLLDFNFADKTLLVTCHAETVGVLDQSHTSSLFSVLQNNPDLNLLFTYPNSDPGGRIIAEKIEEFCKANANRVKVIKSMGFKLYIRTLHHVSAVIGNSSSGLIEVPSIGIPSINIGKRQKGRLKAPSVIDCVWTTESIQHAIDKAFSSKFREQARYKRSPYGSGKTSSTIMSILSKIQFCDLQNKSFYDLEQYYH